MTPPIAKTLLVSSARTATTDSGDQINLGVRGLHVVIDVTADPGTASITFTLQGKDLTSGKYYTLLASSPIADTGTTVLRLYPGIAATANLAASDVLPAVWRLLATHADSQSMTYSVGASLMA